MVDKILAKELVDYSKSDKLLEWQRLIPWINNFAQKKAKGIFKQNLAVKALADYLAKDVLERYAGRRGGISMDAATKLLFGTLMLRHLMPRINRTAEKMKKMGLNKGKLVKEHPDKNVFRHLMR
ncbi:hypothetical protein LCGC14_0510360 [marine sediment metagenome]|uniref:Uncharacterized protein n=1 Tax=marine sediment metagenome TaxID=412755 RepID=A0A0F9S1K4_9ZZZZ